MENNRRDFLKKSAAISAGFLFSNKLFSLVQPGASSKTSATPGSAANINVMSGFIVSDAHFGWENAIQPTPDKQKMMIKAIRKRFPNLDVFVDTGDAHHNGNNRDKERGEWSDIIQYQDEPVPFYYIPGNHEISHARTEDSEMVCAKLGSHELRPYFSFDIKGLHFVSVPQLMRSVYVTREMLEWLKLDLELNKDKTTILLSHNNLIGYSKTYEPGYRGVVNTQEIIDLISEYPNCVAWMYGHNHNYEVVSKINKLFVSNGRIGGFDPSKGKHGLGGIYFEISAEKVDIRCFSAEFDKFVDEFDSTEMYRGTLGIATSFDAAAKPAYSVGVARAKRGEKVPLFHHHSSASNSMELVVAGVGGSVINDDPEFKYYMQRMPADDRQLMGSSISGGKGAYEWKNPGVMMLPTGKRSTITLPRAAHNQFTYYRVAAGQSYKISVDLQGQEGGGQSLSIITKLYDRSGIQIVESASKQFVLSGARQTLTHIADFANQPTVKSIYTDENSDNVFNLSVEVSFDAVMKPVMVHNVLVEFNNAETATKNPSVKVNGQLRVVTKTLNPAQYEKFTVNARAGKRSVIEVDAAGNGMLTWLLKVTDLQWQVLGAQVENRPTSMVIGPMRNLFSHRKEVVINPFDGYETKTFLYRMRNVNQAEVFPIEKGNSKITVKVIETLPGIAELEVYSKRCDLKITGADSWAQNGTKFIIAVKAGSEVTIE